MYHTTGSNEKGLATAAGIDLGSNSFRLLIAEVGEKCFSPLVKELITVRLGEDLSSTGRLSSAAMERGRNALGIFAEFLNRYRPNTCRVCGTHALRDATNSELFVQDARVILGKDISILTGAEEATLSFQGVMFFQGGRLGLPCLVADVGGGSSEFVFAESPNQEPAIASIPLGAVSLTEKTTKKYGNELTELQKHSRALLESQLTKFFSRQVSRKTSLIGTGGTGTALAALDLGLGCYDALTVQNHMLSSSRLRSLIEKLSDLPPAERSALPGLDNKRGEIILAGAVIYQELLSFFGLDSFVVSDAGLLEGILLSGMDC